MGNFSEAMNMAIAELAQPHKHLELPTKTPDKQYTSNICIISGRGPIYIEGPVPEAKLEEYSFDASLNNFRRADQQFNALKKISLLQHGFIYIVRFEKEIIGYVTFCPPDDYLKWGNEEILGLLELGAIEVAQKWRREGLGIRLLKEAFRTDCFEDYLIISMEYYWHWDIDKSELSLWEYRNMLKNVLGIFNFELWKTDDPDIRSHPANTFMVRTGNRIPQSWVDHMGYISTRRRLILGEHI